MAGYNKEWLMPGKFYWPGIQCNWIWLCLSLNFRVFTLCFISISYHQTFRCCILQIVEFYLFPLGNERRMSLPEVVVDIHRAYILKAYYLRKRFPYPHVSRRRLDFSIFLVFFFCFVFWFFFNEEEIIKKAEVTRVW